MNVYTAHQPEIDAAWDAVEQRIEALPPSLSSVGRRFLTSISAGHAGHRAYFSSDISPPLLHVPLWLRDRFRRNRYPSRQATPFDPTPHALLAGMWGYFYIRIQDDIVDGSESRDPELLLFANLCCAEMFSSLRSATAGAPDFWPAFDRAWTDFTGWTLEEQRQVRAPDAYPEALFEAHAQKVSFARIPTLAVCFAAGRPDLEMPLRELIHRLGISYGLVNDVLGWPRDVRSGQRTYLLTRAGLSQAELAACGTQPATVTDPDKVGRLHDKLRRTLYDDGLLCAVLDEAQHWQWRAAEMGALLGLKEIVDYTGQRVQWLEGQRMRIQALRLQRALAMAATTASAAG